jgi:hypothetical protein
VVSWNARWILGSLFSAAFCERSFFLPRLP